MDEEDLQQFKYMAKGIFDDRWNLIKSSGDGSLHAALYMVDLRYSRRQNLDALDDMDGEDFWQRFVGLIMFQIICFSLSVINYENSKPNNPTKMTWNEFEEMGVFFSV